jgi:hypothetical protein
MRDSEGRAYACRVYHEDELEPKSLHESMFEIAELKREDEGNNDDLDSIAIKDSEAEVVESNRISRFDSPNVMSSKLQERLTQLKGMCAQYRTLFCLLPVFLCFFSLVNANLFLSPGCS